MQSAKELREAIRESMALMQANMALMEQAMDALAKAEEEESNARMNLADLPDFLTVDEYAKLTGSNPQATRYRCQIGTIPAFKDGKRWRISKELLLKDLAKFEAA